MANWDETYDFVIVGTGAAGMSAAIRAKDLGATVLLLEKSDKVGGSSAMSGGVCWIANNPYMRAAGIEDTDEAGLEYLEHITRGQVDKARLETYVSESKRMLSYLSENAHVSFDAMEKY
ncbi:MAG: FAD-dependent oxidoreductase [Myxococcales bacterium]|nr:FAD-dependent oxidoreductase [Myxococcales bacterium]